MFTNTQITLNSIITPRAYNSMRSQIPVASVHLFHELHLVEKFYYTTVVWEFSKHHSSAIPLSQSVLSSLHMKLTNLQSKAFFLCIVITYDGSCTVLCSVLLCMIVQTKFILISSAREILCTDHLNFRSNGLSAQLMAISAVLDSHSAGQAIQKLVSSSTVSELGTSLLWGFVDFFIVERAIKR